MNLIALLARAIARMEGYLDANGNVIAKGRSGRNNNPGNLRDVWIEAKKRWWIWPQLEHDDQGFPRFHNAEDGYAALYRDLQLKIDRGDTLREIIYAWAPPKENDTALYLANVAKWTNLPAEQPLRELISGTAKPLAQVAYEAYSGHTGGRSLATGQTLPEWPALRKDIQDAWGSAAEAVTRVTKES